MFEEHVKKACNPRYYMSWNGFGKAFDDYLSSRNMPHAVEKQ
jgi:hypothetical protein